MTIDWTLQRWERWTLGIMGLMAVVFGLMVARSWKEAHAAPIVAKYRMQAPALVSAGPVTIAFLSDTHVNEEMAASSINLARLSAVAERINALKPDIVILGGDYVMATNRPGNVPFRGAVAPFSTLRARYGVFGVIGNHDCHEPENTPAIMRQGLIDAGVTPLVNEFAQAGPITIAGLDDLWCGSSDIATAGRAVKASAGRPVILVSHNPDVFPDVPPSIGLTLAGHTHGAQIVPPIVGPIVSASRYGQRYRYGAITEGRRTMIVSSGLGGLPLRWNAPPEIVLVTLLPGRT